MADSSAFDPDAFKQLEHSGWVEVAGRYHESFSSLTSHAAVPLLDAARVTEGKRLLDIATGPGYAVAAAAARGAQAIGIDFSSTMVEEARSRHPGLDFREGDAEALSFGDAEFDAVTIGFGMLHFSRPERALAEAFRVLRSGGRLAFTVWDAPERAVAFGLVHRAIEKHGVAEVGLPEGPPFYQFSDPEECRRTLSRAGFVPDPTRTLPLTWRVESADAMLSSFCQGGVRTRALLRAQTPEARTAIRAAVSESVKAYAHDGAFELPAPAVLAAGEKPRGA